MSQESQQLSLTFRLFSKAIILKLRLQRVRGQDENSSRVGERFGACSFAGLKDESRQMHSDCPRASIYIEDTTTSTCWDVKCLWSQLLSFLLNLWAPPLLATGTCETQGLRETNSI